MPSEYWKGVLNNLVTGENKSLVGKGKGGAAEEAAAVQKEEQVADAAKNVAKVADPQTGGGVPLTQETEDRSSVAKNTSTAYRDKLGYGGGAYGF